MSMGGSSLNESAFGVFLGKSLVEMVAVQGLEPRTLRI